MVREATRAQRAEELFRSRDQEVQRLTRELNSAHKAARRLIVERDQLRTSHAAARDAWAKDREKLYREMTHLAEALSSAESRVASQGVEISEHMLHAWKLRRVLLFFVILLLLVCGVHFLRC